MLEQSPTGLVAPGFAASRVITEDLTSAARLSSSPCSDVTPIAHLELKNIYSINRYRFCIVCTNSFKEVMFNLPITVYELQ